MRIRRTFFLAIPLGLILATLAYFALFSLQLGAPTPNSRWCAEMLEKKRAAANAIAGPKLLIVAGSSGLTGISAEEIHRATGFPTVNFSLHAALGPYYILRVARQNLRPGDTVLLAFEYDLYDYGDLLASSTDDLFIDFILSRDPDYVRALPLRPYAKLALQTPGSRILRGLRSIFAKPKPVPASQVFRSENISLLGDQLGCTREARPPHFADRIGASGALANGLPAEPAGFPAFRDFCAWARANHIRVLATFPNIAHVPEYDLPSAEKAPQKIRDFFKSMDVPVLGEARDAFLPKDEFFDTLYHPLHEAAIARTRRLLVHLAPYLTPKPASVR